jgi:BirA family biotin operon repressor/biotin-[acetyl-CoA-carboxylase] ligase
MTPSPPASGFIDSEALVRRLKGSLLGGAVRLLDEVGSTNDLAWEWAALGAPEGALVVARAQTRGRGRAGRTWLSPAGGGLWFSVVLRPGLVHPSAGMLPLAVGFGVAGGLRRLGLPAELKWPNDVLVGGRKVCGVLVEGRFSGSRLATAVVGVGVNWTVPEVPERAGRVTGLEAEFSGAGGRRSPGPPSPEDALATLLLDIEKAYLVLHGAGTAPFVRAWPAYSAHFARPVRLSRPGGGAARASVAPLRSPRPLPDSWVLSGGLLPDGRLEVLAPDGTRLAVDSADAGLDLEQTLPAERSTG